jgi:hypothetical protein
MHTLNIARYWIVEDVNIFETETRLKPIQGKGNTPKTQNASNPDISRNRVKRCQRFLVYTFDGFFSLLFV